MIKVAWSENPSQQPWSENPSQQPFYRSWWVARRSGGGRFGGDGVAEVLEAGDEPAADGVAVALVEVAGAEVVVDAGAPEQVEGDDEDGVADGDGGLLAAAPGGESAVLRAEV